MLIHNDPEIDELRQKKLDESVERKRLIGLINEEFGDYYG
jgi:hypothetical protein